VMVHGYNAYSDWSLTGTYSASAFAKPDGADTAEVQGGCNASSGQGGSGGAGVLVLLALGAAVRRRRGPPEPSRRSAGRGVWGA